MNRNVSRFILGGIIILLLILFFPFIFNFNMTPQEHYRNITFLIPIVVALFFIPISVLTLKSWDIHLNFIEDKGRFRLSISNFGETAFNFNKIAFVSYKRFLLFGSVYPGHHKDFLTIMSNSMEPKPLPEYYTNTLDAP